MTHIADQFVAKVLVIVVASLPGQHLTEAKMVQHLLAGERMGIPISPALRSLVQLEKCDPQIGYNQLRGFSSPYSEI